MRYFSIDYRSPPSGMGQIIDTTKPEMIGDRYNYILITSSDGIFGLVSQCALATNTQFHIGNGICIVDYYWQHEQH